MEKWRLEHAGLEAFAGLESIVGGFLLDGADD
jgi:hypothetical protein